MWSSISSIVWSSNENMILKVVVVAINEMMWRRKVQYNISSNEEWNENEK